MRRARLLRRLLALTLAAIGVSIAGAAWGYFTSTGATASAASIGSLNAPTDVTVPANAAGSVHVSWTTSVVSGGAIAPDGYFVTRVDGGSTYACGTSPTVLTNNVSCDDSPVADGTYHYTVTAAYHSWTATSASSGDVVVQNDTTPPAVTSIERTSSAVTNSSSVSWTVTFSENVTGVDTGDFSLVNTGLGGAPSITGISGSGSSYTITASTGTGDGSLGIDLVDDDSIVDGASNKLGGTGAGNGNTTGQVYSIDRTAPTLSSITLSDASPTNASSVSWMVAFTEPVSGVTAANFTLASAGLAGSPTITSVSGTAPTATWTVVASAGSGNGTLGVDKTSNVAVSDSAGNDLTGGTVTGSAYTIDRTAPSVVLSLTATNRASLSSGSIYYKRNESTGSLRTLKLEATVSDAGGAAPASASFPAIGASGWTHAAEGPITTPGSGVYDSSAFTWTTSAADAASYVVTVADTAGNTSQATVSFVNDSIGPTNSLSLTNPTGSGSFLSGSTLFYKGNGAGSFTITNSLTDGGSGSASTNFPTLTGTSTNWTHTGAIVSSPAAGPHVSSAFSWAAPTSSSPTEVVTATDKVGNTTSITLTFTNDVTAPSVTPTVADASARVSTFLHQGGTYYVYSNSTEVGSGVQTITADVSALSGGAGGACYDLGNNPVACSAVPLSTVGGPFPVTNSTGSGTTNFAYRSTLQTAQSSLSAGSKTLSASATDNVGNASSAQSFSAIVDNTGPTLTTSLSSGGGNSKVTTSGTASKTSTDFLTVTVYLCTSTPCTAAGATYTASTNVNSGTGAYSDTSGNIGSGTYYARVEQMDFAGNVGVAAAGPFVR